MSKTETLQKTATYDMSLRYLKCSIIIHTCNVPSLFCNVTFKIFYLCFISEFNDGLCIEINIFKTSL